MTDFAFLLIDPPDSMIQFQFPEFAACGCSGIAVDYPPHDVRAAVIRDLQYQAEVVRHKNH